MQTVDNLRPGTAAYAFTLANWLDVQAARLCEASLTYTDIRLCAAALRSTAGRWRRRAGVALAIAVLAAIAVGGVEDRNHDGRADIVDVWLGVRAIVASVPAAICAALDGRRP